MPEPGGAGARRRGRRRLPLPAAGAPPAGGAAGRTLIASGFRPSTSATRPCASNFTTWLADPSMVQTLSWGSTRRPNAVLKP